MIQIGPEKQYTVLQLPMVRYLRRSLSYKRNEAAGTARKRTIITYR